MDVLDTSPGGPSRANVRNGNSGGVRHSNSALERVPPNLSGNLPTQITVHHNFSHGGGVRLDLGLATPSPQLKRVELGMFLQT